jgi:hypothetical protein
LRCRNFTPLLLLLPPPLLLTPAAAAAAAGGGVSRGSGRALKAMNGMKKTLVRNMMPVNHRPCDTMAHTTTQEIKARLLSSTTVEATFTQAKQCWLVQGMSCSLLKPTHTTPTLIALNSNKLPGATQVIQAAALH